MKITPTEARVAASGLADHCAVPGTLEGIGGRARPNQLRQSDPFTFVRKLAHRRGHLLPDVDDRSRLSTGSRLSRNT